MQLDRDTKYRACQEVTLESSKETILCFMGYTHKYKGIPLHHLSLSLFRSPPLVAAFVSYVLARGVSRGWVARLISSCKKVCSYLNSQHPWGPHSAMDQWLTRLDQQVPMLMPKLPPPALPSAGAVFAWVDKLVEACMESYNKDMDL